MARKKFSKKLQRQIVSRKKAVRQPTEAASSSLREPNGAVLYVVCDIVRSYAGKAFSEWKSSSEGSHTNIVGPYVVGVEL